MSLKSTFDFLGHIARLMVGITIIFFTVPALCALTRHSWRKFFLCDNFRGELKRARIERAKKKAKLQVQSVRG
jgi:hypothetical protein